MGIRRASNGIHYVAHLSHLWQPLAKGRGGHSTADEQVLLVVCDRKDAAACSAARQLQTALQTFLKEEGWTVVISSASEDNVLAVRRATTLQLESPRSP